MAQTIDIQSVLQILAEAIMIAQKRGAYSLDEAEKLAPIIRAIVQPIQQAPQNKETVINNSQNKEAVVNNSLPSIPEDSILI